MNGLIAELDHTLSGGERSLPPGMGAASRGFDPYSNWQNQSDGGNN
ncbi:MAG: hypothetical protein SPF59_03680 [Oscillospiraceae bacterium]|nr:hypothetical protein [Oscillospiraceae bacterium]